MAGQSLSLFDSECRSRQKAERLIGIDEAGRGPLAGPVVAAAVILPLGPLPELADVDDSKKLTERRREELFPVIRRSALAVGVGWADASRIDAVNILNATFEAMLSALSRLRPAGAAPGPLDLVLVDGDKTLPGLTLRQEALVGGDARSLCVASASIVAKVVRDRWMRALDREFPGYGFVKHKGYPTGAHRAAIARLGPSAAHRRSFRVAA